MFKMQFPNFHLSPCLYIATKCNSNIVAELVSYHYNCLFIVLKHVETIGKLSIIQLIHWFF